MLRGAPRAISLEATRNRVLVLAGHSQGSAPAVDALRDRYDVVEIASIDEAIEALRHQHFDAVFSDSGDFLPLERALVSQQANLILNTIGEGVCIDRKSTRLNSSHANISYAVFCLKKKKTIIMNKSTTTTRHFKARSYNPIYSKPRTMCLSSPVSTCSPNTSLTSNSTRSSNSSSSTLLKTSTIDSHVFEGSASNAVNAYPRAIGMSSPGKSYSLNNSLTSISTISSNESSFTIFFFF